MILGFAPSMRIVAAYCLIAFSASSTLALAQTPRDKVGSIALGSSCAKVNWDKRGPAPDAYLKGMVLVYARSLCHINRPDVALVSSGRHPSHTAFEGSDALTFYDSRFSSTGMSNDKTGQDTLRHVYTMLISLGMQESSGMLCAGRDKSEGFGTADSAEAGLLQTSWGVHRKSTTLTDLFKHYQADRSACLLDAFNTPPMHCTSWDAQTWGKGEGADWQKLTKACPAFAVEYGAVVTRVSGGVCGEFGPIRKTVVEIRPECDNMLSKVQSYVQSSPDICKAFD